MFNRNALSRLQAQRALIAGLCLFSLLLLSAVTIAWRTIHHIDDHTKEFEMRQAAAKESIVKIERQQDELNRRWQKLARNKDVISRDEILAQTEQNREDMGVALDAAYQQAEFLRESIYAEGHGLLRWTVWLFGLCVLLSIACASWAVSASTQLFKRLETLQYQFLETQENTARRFSHELHDELGQSLAAVKANLAALRWGAGEARAGEPRAGEARVDQARVDDCMGLVDQAIQDVRQMSQLLRPTILDDFGLDAALRVLTNGFAKRTGLVVRYESDVGSDRLKDETETSLYRIAQEALTNIARHSGATEVAVKLTKRTPDMVLEIGDNGKGIDMAKTRAQPGLGLAGMQTRARGCGGTVRIESAAGKGFRIEVTCPIAR